MQGSPPKKLLSFAERSIFPVTANQKNLFTLLLRRAPYAILILTALLYSKAVFNDFNNFDDDAFILNNPLVKDLSWKGIVAIFSNFNNGKYQPLTTLSFAIEYHFFGFKPLVFHLTDVILHLLSTWYVFKIAERLSGHRITAIVVSVLFAVHPLHVEDVAWASERKDLLYALFYLLALLNYLRYIDSGFRIKYYLLTFLFFLVSLFSKTEAISLPLLMIVTDVYKQRRINGKVLLEKMPFLLFFFLFAVLGFISNQSDGGLGNVSVSNYYGLINRIFLFTSVPAFYIIKLIAPFGLSAMHYYPDVHNGALPWPYYASLPFMLFIIWVIVRRNSFRREMLFGISFFLVTICVMPQIVFVGPSLTPERYSYIPYIGFFYVIGQWMTTITMPVWKNLAGALFMLLIIFFCVQTWLRIDVWKSSETLYTDVLEKNASIADCSYFHWSMGNTMVIDGKLPEAIEEFSEALREHPGYAEAYANRGVAYFQAGDIKPAISDLDVAIRLKSSDPRTYYNRASCEASIGNFAKALTDYNVFIALKPDDKTAYADRGMVRLSLKDTTGACEDWKKAAGLGNDMALQLLQNFGPGHIQR